MPSFEKSSWTGETVSPRRLARINDCQRKLTHKRTEHEKRFAKFMSGLCRRGGVLHFTPQKVFHVHAEQAFIVDFYFKSFRTVVEIDGSWHGRQKAYDDWRTQVLGTRNIQVVRFANSEIETDIHGTCRRTIEALRSTGRHSAKLAEELAAIQKAKPVLYAKVFTE